MIAIETILQKHLLPEVAGKIVALKPVGHEWVACCPFHVDRSPSFTIFHGGTRFHCFGCGASGDVLDFVQRVYGVDLIEAARLLNGGEVPTVAQASRPDAHARTAEKQAAARSIWQRTIPAAGTLAESYMDFRGIRAPFPSDVRFLRLRCDNLGSLPCMVLAVRNVAGEVTGIQRIWLACDGRGKADVAKPKRSLGTLKGGAIRLGTLDGSGVITVCEGPEDGLSLLAMLDRPVWVSAGTSFLPSMQFPAEICSVVIGADNDPAGSEAAERAARAYVRRGLTVRIIRPLEGFKDFNDELKGVR